MAEQFALLCGASLGKLQSAAWSLLRAVPVRAARPAAATSAQRPKQLRWVSFALLALLALDPFSRAQTSLPSGSVVVWGSDPCLTDLTDVPSEAQSGVVAIAARGGHVLALKSDGSVVAWPSGFAATHVPVAARSGVVAIAAGQAHSVALKDDGSVVAWGVNASGPPANMCGITDVPSEAQSGVVAIAAGRYHTLALKNDGTVVAWGDNLHGQVTGIAPTALPRCAVAAPVTLRGQVLSGVTAIAGGGAHSLALKSDGSVVAWGWNVYRQATVPVAARSAVVAIAGGLGHSVALKSDGSVVAWGSGMFVGGMPDVPVAARSGVVAIAAGEYHSVALKDDGSLLAWGNPSPETGVPADHPPVFAIAVPGGCTDSNLDIVALVREAPLLSILRNPDQTLSLSWSGAGVLEQTGSLTAPDWQPAPVQGNPQIISTTDPMKFFRVRAD